MDERQHRPKLANQGGATVGTTAVELLGPNVRRIGIVISGPQSGFCTVTFKGPAVLGQGVCLMGNTSPLNLTEDHIGQAIREEVSVICSVAGQTIGFLEIFV